MKRTLMDLMKPCLALAFVAMIPMTALPFDKLPAEKAGTIGKLQGRIAFVRDGNIWAMDANGANQQLVSEVGNADGRLTWSPDGKKIIFTRSGQVNVQAPDNSGGQHKLYDLFLADIDSVYAGMTMYWFPLTGDVGNRDPEWSVDGSKIVFWKDLNANNVNASEPNYQICIMEPPEDTLMPYKAKTKILRTDWKGAKEFLIAPTMNANGDIACVCLYDMKPQGLVVLPKDKYMMPMDSLKTLARKNLNCVAPAWSPDGKWLAYVNNDLNDGGLYIAAPDLKEKYLVFKPPPSTNMYTVAPSFSPDSKWLTFSTVDGSVWISDITGNGARRLTGPGSDKFPAWSKTPQN